MFDIDITGTLETFLGLFHIYADITLMYKNLHLT